MVMRHGGQFVHGHALGHRRDDFVDQFAAHRADAAAAKDFAGFRVASNFTKPSLASMMSDLPWSLNGYVATAYGIFAPWAPSSVRPTAAICGSVNTISDQQAVIHLAGVVGMGDIVRGDFALLDGDVNDLVRPAQSPAA